MNKFVYLLTLSLCHSSNKNNYILSIEKEEVVKETNTIYEVKSYFNNLRISKNQIGIVENRYGSYSCIECYVYIDNKNELKKYKAKLEEQLLIRFNKIKNIILELENSINNGFVIRTMNDDNDEYIV